MDLKGIVSISGMSGLFKIIAQVKMGFIAESLLDRKRIPVPSSYRLSALEDISVYTTDGEVPLKEVFLKIKEKEGGQLTVDSKSDSKLLREYFKSILPNLDEQRIYNSDIKKIISWYLILKDQIITEEIKPDETSVDEVESSEVDEKPKKSSKPKVKAKKEKVSKE